MVRDDGKRDEQPDGPDHTLPPRAPVLDAVQEAAALKGHAGEQQHGDRHGHAGVPRVQLHLEDAHLGGVALLVAEAAGETQHEQRDGKVHHRDGDQQHEGAQ